MKVIISEFEGTWNIYDSNGMGEIEDFDTFEEAFRYAFDAYMTIVPEHFKEYTEINVKLDTEGINEEEFIQMYGKPTWEYQGNPKHVWYSFSTAKQLYDVMGQKDFMCTKSVHEIKCEPRVMTLLRASRDIISKCITFNPCGATMEQTAIWDGVESDAKALLKEMNEFLEDE